MMNAIATATRMAATWLRSNVPTPMPEQRPQRDGHDRQGHGRQARRVVGQRVSPGRASRCPGAGTPVRSVPPPRRTRAPTPSWASALAATTRARRGVARKVGGDRLVAVLPRHRGDPHDQREEVGAPTAAPGRRPPGSWPVSSRPGRGRHPPGPASSPATRARPDDGLQCRQQDGADEHPPPQPGGEGLGQLRAHQVAHAPPVLPRSGRGRVVRGRRPRAVSSCSSMPCRWANRPTSSVVAPGDQQHVGRLRPGHRVPRAAHRPSTRSPAGRAPGCGPGRRPGPPPARRGHRGRPAGPASSSRRRRRSAAPPRARGWRPARCAPPEPACAGSPRSHAHAAPGSSPFAGSSSTSTPGVPEHRLRRGRAVAACRARTRRLGARRHPSIPVPREHLVDPGNGPRRAPGRPPADDCGPCVRGGTSTAPARPRRRRGWSRCA